MITLANTSKILFWVLSLIWLAFSVALISGCSLVSSAPADHWVSLGAPPSGAASVIAANGSEIWVSSNEGDSYSTHVTFNCETGDPCWEWQPAKTLPKYALPISDVPTGPRSDDKCDTFHPSRPVANPKGNIVQCIYSPALAGETIAEFYFALMSDGTIMFLDNSPGFNPFTFDSFRNINGLLEPAG